MLALYFNLLLAYNSKLINLLQFFKCAYLFRRAVAPYFVQQTRETKLVRDLKFHGCFG
jgi:hypothetical protein